MKNSALMHNGERKEYKKLCNDHRMFFNSLYGKAFLSVYNKTR